MANVFNVWNKYYYRKEKESKRTNWNENQQAFFSRCGLRLLLNYRGIFSSLIEWDGILFGVRKTRHFITTDDRRDCPGRGMSPICTIASLSNMIKYLISYFTDKLQKLFLNWFIIYIKRVRRSRGKCINNGNSYRPVQFLFIRSQFTLAKRCAA